VSSASLVRTPFKVAASTGLGAVIVRVQALFKAIKWAGIAYSRLIQALTSWQPAMAI
jgi:threonine/homoserine/homoserine lactone efflux protein